MNNLNYNTELISKEIEDLFSTVEEFITKKDVLTESIKQMYLNTSTVN